MKRLVLALVLALGALSALPALAVNPDEMLKDPALEARARQISEGLRCVVCRGETIDESNASIAHDLRVLVRERLLKGDTDAQVMQYIVDRYGEYVLMKPTAKGANLILWGAGPALFLLALAGAGLYLRRRSKASEPAADLSAEEKARVAEIMGG